MKAAELRAVGRLGRRTARREWRRTLLISLLVALPVAVSLVVAGMVRASDVSPEERLASAFGTADVRVELQLGGQPEGSQRLSAWLAEAVDDLAPSADVVRYRHTYDADMEYLVDLDITTEVSDGILAAWDGDLPSAPGEVAVSPALLRHRDAQIGDEFTDPHGHELTIVGTVVDPISYHRRIVLVTSDEFDRLLATDAVDNRNHGETWLLSSVDDPELLVDALSGRWEAERASILPEPAVDPRPAGLASLADDIYVTLTAEQIEVLAEMAQTAEPWEVEDVAWQLADEQGYMTWSGPWVSSRASELHGWRDPITERLMAPGVVATLVAGVLLAEVALIAGAAYATGARRRLREIGLLSANGATVSHVRVSVLGEALVAGILGAAAGVVLGVVALLAGRPLIQPVIDRYLTGLPLTAGAVIGPAVAGVVAVTAAAWLPARNAARVSTTTALQGRMPLSSPPTWLAPGGVALAGFGALITTVSLAAGGGGRASGVLAVIGILFAIVGTALLTPPIIAMLGRFADRLPATWRLVVRDSTRQRTRAAAATAAAMVLLMAPVLIGIVSASDEARGQVTGLPQPADHLAVSTADAIQGRSVAAVRVEDAAADGSDVSAASDAVAALLPDAAITSVPLLPLRGVPATAPDLAQGFSGNMHSDATEVGFQTQVAAGVATPEVVRALGDDRVRASIHADVPVVLGVRERDTSVTLEDGTVIDAREIPLAVAWSFPRLLLPPGMAEELRVWPSEELALFTGVELTPDLQERIWSAAFDAGVVVTYGSDGFSPAMTRWLAVGAALLAALLILGLVTALSTTESDHDLRTMVAVGAPPRIRRRFLALQTGYHAVIGAALAVPLGIGLSWAAVRSDPWRTIGPFGEWTSNAIAVPWPVLSAVVLGLPVAIGALTATIFRSAPTVPPRRLG